MSYTDAMVSINLMISCYKTKLDYENIENFARDQVWIRGKIT